MVWHQPFDLYYWFVNVFAGSLPMFLAIALLVIASITAMFRMSTLITGVLFLTFILMMSVAITGTYYIVALFLVALIIGWAVARWLK